MTPTYPATPYLRRMTRENGWHDAVAIESEDRCVALRHPTHDDGPILPTEPSDTAGAEWFRDGRCVDVLAELFELECATSRVSPWWTTTPRESGPAHYVALRQRRGDDRPVGTRGSSPRDRHA